MDPDPANFVIDLQDASKKLIFNIIFCAYYFLKLHLHHFTKIKSQKESQNSRNQGFSYYFCVMIEGSGSGRSKNMWFRRIRIRNAGLKYSRTSPVTVHLVLTGGGGLPWWGILLVTLFTVIVLFVIVKCCIELQVSKVLILP